MQELLLAIFVFCETSRKLIQVLLSASRPRAHARPVGPKSTPLLRTQEPAIVEYRGSRPVNSITGSKIASRVNRSTRREPSAFERNTMLRARTLIFVMQAQTSQTHVIF